jgi:hypothetical protein
MGSINTGLILLILFSFCMVLTVIYYIVVNLREKQNPRIKFLSKILKRNRTIKPLDITINDKEDTLRCPERTRHML